MGHTCLVVVLYELILVFFLFFDLFCLSIRFTSFVLFYDYPH